MPDVETEDRWESQIRENKQQQAAAALHCTQSYCTPQISLDHVGHRAADDAGWSSVLAALIACTG